MQADQLLLKDFRNIPELDLSFHPHVNILYGQNAQGKTNLLEAVYFCATGRSHRTSYDKECIRYQQPEAFIKLLYTRRKQDTIELHLRRNGRKGVAFNKAPVRKIEDLFGCLSVIMFSPEDLSLIKNGPMQRRTFMDLEICQTDPVYLHTLKEYHRILKQRGQVLKQLNGFSFSYEESLLPWDQQLAEKGVRLIQMRARFIEKLADRTAKIHEKISHGTEHLDLSYEKNMEADVDMFLEKLKNTVQRDIILGSTQTGPHRDDIAMMINGQDVRSYGSQGQQRTTALSMKLAEMELMEEAIGTPPILLLDDVMSELDQDRQTHMIQYIERCQTLITCTGVEDSIRRLPVGARYLVENGTVVVKS